MALMPTSASASSFASVPRNVPSGENVPTWTSQMTHDDVGSGAASGSTRSRATTQPGPCTPWGRARANGSGVTSPSSRNA